MEPEPTEGSILQIARQAIFDRESNVVAYELLYRSDAEATASDRDDSGSTVAVVSAALFSHGVAAVSYTHLTLPTN